MSIDEKKLSPEQIKMKKGIQNTGRIIGFNSSLVIGILIWLFTKEIYPHLCYLFAIASLPATYWISNATYVSLKASDAKCKDCGADFSVNHTNKEKNFLSAIPKRSETISGRAISGTNEGKNIITVRTWTEEKYEVINTYTCISCKASRRTKSFKTVVSGQQSNKIYR